MLYRELLQAGSQVENHNGSDGTLPSSCVSNGNHGSMNITQKDISSVQELQAEATEQPAACKKDELSEARNRVSQCIKDSLAAIESLDRVNKREDFSMLQKRDSEDALGDRGIEKTLSTLLSLLGYVGNTSTAVDFLSCTCFSSTMMLYMLFLQNLIQGHGKCRGFAKRCVQKIDKRYC